MAVTQLSLYNDAAILLGERRLSAVTEDIELRHNLDALYDNGAVDYCLEMVKPRYSTLVATIAGITPTATTAYTYQVPLPAAGFLTLATDAQGRPAVYGEGRLEQPVERFIYEDDYLLTDFATVFVRYVQDHSTLGFGAMPHSFGRVVSAYMARELAWKFDPDSEEQIQTKLEQRIEVSMGLDKSIEPASRGNAPTTLDAFWLPIYNDALLMLKLEPIVNINDDSLRKYRLDLTRSAEVVEAVMEDTAWQFGIQTAEVDYQSLIVPTWGFTYGIPYPAGVHLMNGVYTDEMLQNPLRDYRDEVHATYGQTIYCNLIQIYMQYIATSWLTDPEEWPAYFKRLVAARMAVDANIPDSDIETAVKQYDNRRKAAMSTDVLSGPPKRILEGSWARTRRGTHGKDRDWG